MATPKEIYFDVMRHRTPERLINILSDGNFIIPILGIERWPEEGMGKDGFDVSGTFVKDAGAPMPTPDIPPLVSDITRWREQMKLPDLDR